MGSQDDDTELKRRLAAAEERLRESDARHRLLIESWAQAVWETDAAGVVVTDSPSWRAYTGQTLPEWLGYGWLDAIHPEDRAYAERQWREAVAARGLVNAEFRLRAPDGGWRWTNVRAAPMLDAAGQIEKWLGLNVDIDDRKRSEAALRDEEARYRSLFDNMGQGYADIELVRDSEGRAVDQLYHQLNPAMERLFGLDAATMIGRRGTEFFGDVVRYWSEIFDPFVKSGSPARIEDKFGERWFDVLAYPRGGDRLAIFYEEVTEQKQIEAARRENEERQAFLLKLSDAVRPLEDPLEIETVVTTLTMDHFAADRCYYCAIENGDIVVRRDASAEDLPSIKGRYPLPSFPIFQRIVKQGAPMVVSDVRSTELLDEDLKAICTSLDIFSFIDVPVVKAGGVVGIMSLNQAVPRSWSRAEVELVQEIAERVWAAVERTRSEVALRNSEARFQQFANASAAGLWIRDAQSFHLEYASPAVETIFGARGEAFLDDVKHWASLIVPEDREIALGDLEDAQDGQSRAREFRIQRPRDGAFRWIRNTVFPLVNDRGHVERIGGIAEDVTDARQLAEYQEVLLAELQHRVRNIMGVIRSIANRTAGGSGGVEDYRSLLEGRLLALARVQALLTREANSVGSLRDIIESEVLAQAHHRGQFDLTGPDVKLSPKAVEVLTLAFHELATNALKYGALSVPDGRLTVSWTTVEKRGGPWLALDWMEGGAPPRPPSKRRGFGSELIEARIPYELGGAGRIDLGREGARCHLEFPLRDGGSILETDAPRPSTVFGGMLDMTGEPDLSGRTVLVIEDDFYTASDTAAAVRGAGANVLGPCPSLEATLEVLERETPTHAVLDLNLGGRGPRFEIAHLLRARGVPFVFVTGYDPDVIPADLEDVVLLQKPVPFHAIVDALGRLERPDGVRPQRGEGS
jgi:PAS domain S-box-containing protein